MSDRPKPRAGADDVLAKIVTKDWFRSIAPKVIPPMHRAMNRFTRGRFVPGAGLVLYTIGAKSGQRRETPLEAVPSDGNSWVIVGSNFAREHHPAWTGNLIAHPDCEILVRGTTMTARATLLDGDERDAAWQEALAHFGGWQAYTDITDRSFRIFRLSPT
ncbi:MAG: nitroreductase family deazaflavin-dependent oxidoreductase [Actinomycetota bacterium]